MPVSIPTSFGEDENGELYLVNGRGEIYHLVATAAAAN